ncbi:MULTISPECIES: hypothetical protein [Natrialbaceae]|uniref:hypothetical protein n=1 Tax=Natrialbaceae TaxID=1644061 RepID=UPI00207D6F00|nr:hypothetical protein [Natronococcus sp. CG52]
MPFLANLDLTLCAGLHIEQHREQDDQILQAEQAECHGVVRKSSISVMTRRLWRLEPLDPEAVHEAPWKSNPVLFQYNLIVFEKVGYDEDDLRTLEELVNAGTEIVDEGTADEFKHLNKA